MECPKCHLENPDDSRFCSKCGTQIHPLKENSSPHTKTLQASIRELAIGNTFAGRYQIIEELGKGGMGEVYKVFDRKIKEKVALKLLNPEIASDEEMIERFRNELKFARKISHRNVCRMYDLSEKEGIQYITMEYVPGEDLKSTIRRVGQLSVGKSISIAKQVCEGLAEAHQLGVIHRDLKPQNIMIDREGNTRIMDFGIARSLKAKGITRAKVMIGTPEYMSPEQVEAREVDQSSDVYSLGVILYEMLTGEVPFGGDTPLSIIFKHKNEVPPNPKEFNAQIPEDLSRVILKCMEKDKERRYQGARELLAELNKIEKSIPTTERITLEKAKRRKLISIHKRKLKWVTTLIVMALVIFGGYHLWKGFIQPQYEYENFILLEISEGESPEIQKNLVEYLLLRSITASTNLNILVQEDIITYKRKTEATEKKSPRPLIVITGDVYPKVMGFEISISMRSKEKTTPWKKFECKGPIDLISDKIGKIHSFISDESDGIIGNIEGDRSFSQICSDNLDALSHFLGGEEAWEKLDSDIAYSEFKTAVEIDPEFSLAHLRLADVLLFRGDREEARENIKTALDKKDKLVKYDLLILNALMARINFKPIEERQYIGRLKEAFPFKKEYHYEFAESYFHWGDPSEAIKHYLKALEIDPDYSLAHNHIAFCYSWTGNHKLAEKHFIKYVELDNTANSYDSLASGYMFAGMYDKAINALNKGKELNPTLDYLYGNLAQNFILRGFLSKAVETLKEEAAITKRETTKINTHFYLAYIEFLRGNIEKSIQELKHVTDFYLDKRYIDRLDESPNLPFWLKGVISAKRRDLNGLREVIKRMKQKIDENEINATNYFPIYKLFIHLKLLEGYLKKDINIIKTSIEEGQRIRKKMGYWGSIFNVSYFFNEYAEILIRLNITNEAFELLKESVGYNSNYVASHLSLAKIHLNNNDIEEAQKEHQKALDLLSNADKDSIFVREAENISRKF
ncbi:MAG: protein kinase [Candidatus Aminicenantaceae bacterium]